MRHIQLTLPGTSTLDLLAGAKWCLVPEPLLQHPQRHLRPLHHPGLPDQAGIGQASLSGLFSSICIALGELTLLRVARIPPVPVRPLRLEKAGGWFWQDPAAPAPEFGGSAALSSLCMSKQLQTWLIWVGKMKKERKKPNQPQPQSHKQEFYTEMGFFSFLFFFLSYAGISIYLSCITNLCT